MEDYPSSAEGIGLENRQVLNGTRGFKSLILLFYYRGVEQLAARRAHNPEAVGSSPTPAIENIYDII